MHNYRIWNLTGKRAVVTGASRGIGREIALGFATAGADVVVNFLREEEKAREVAACIRTLGRKSEICKADVSLEPEVRRLAEFAVRFCGGFDIWVNNAGFFEPVLLTRLTMEQWNRMMAVNFQSSLFGTKYAVKEMLKTQSPGAILNIASLSALEPGGYEAAYAAAKAGVIAMTLAAAKEYGPWGIRANVIAPGLTRTDLTRRVRAAGPKGFGPSGDNSPGWDGENLLEPSEIAFLACFLASDEARHITGKVFKVRRSPEKKAEEGCF